jgi:TRAP-type mannitol/chloroaromatic compound transport system permease small subunit
MADQTMVRDVAGQIAPDRNRRDVQEVAFDAPHTPVGEWREDRPLMLRISDALRQCVDFVGSWASWLIIPLVVITGIDVIGRKIVWHTADGGVNGVQIWLTRNVSTMFESTMMQEMEWHFHTALFALVLGYGYIYNTHVRVDLIREKLNFRKKAWLELIGLSVFMIPFTVTVIWFAIDYAHSSFVVGEISASTVGLSHRWIIKSILVVGLIVAAIAGISIWLQVAMVLWGDPNRRFKLMTLEWPEETGSTIEGKERIKLEGDDVIDALAPVPLVAAFKEKDD